MSAVHGHGDNRSFVALSTGPSIVDPHQVDVSLGCSSPLSSLLGRTPSRTAERYGSPLEVNLDYGKVRSDDLFESGTIDVWKYQALYPFLPSSMDWSST
jgi:hypothetical protein